MQNEITIKNNPLLLERKLHQFTLKIADKPYRCNCDCNVFHVPDKDYRNIYRCNSCGRTFETA